MLLFNTDDFEQDTDYSLDYYLIFEDNIQIYFNRLRYKKYYKISLENFLIYLLLKIETRFQRLFMHLSKSKV